MPEAVSPQPVPAAQPATGLLTSSAIFLVVVVKDGDAAEGAVRGICGDLAGLVRAVGFREPSADLSCVLGIGSDLWDRLSASRRPIGLHPFREVVGAKHHAVATPGDLLFHIRANRFDMCFELAAQIVTALGDAVGSADEVHGFRYFENRDLLGFVDGTENPVGPALAEAAFIGDEDPPFAGGSYVIVQKYLHDLDAWNRIPTEDQELIIGRRKLSDIELDDATKPTYAHSALATIEIDGNEVKIVRDNMPFGRAGSGEFGTYFIGYARRPDPIELMLHNMFVGRPEGNSDRILDVSTPTTGSLFFVPSVPVLEDLADG
jgi:putative iron-dependent peroxidase